MSSNSDFTVQTSKYRAKTPTICKVKLNAILENPSHNNIDCIPLP